MKDTERATPTIPYYCEDCGYHVTTDYKHFCFAPSPTGVSLASALRHIHNLFQDGVAARQEGEKPRG